ncbi:MAG: stage V sporulation protein T [Firmicutes bacterium]|nr:stage V sporulation protein T [Bacillota bacterium]
MKATGIVRRIDDLGRVVIPKEIRRTLRIREGDPLEIFVDRDGEVILKKYSPIGELGEFAQEYSDSLHETTNHVAIITDRDAVVAISGAPKKQWIDRSIVTVVEEAMESRRTITAKKGEHPEEDIWDFAMQVIAPIISEGDPIGAVILGTNETNRQFGELETKLCETAAGFLAKQMEQ